MLLAKGFKCGNSPAIRMPKEYPVQGKEFIVKSYDNCYFLIPSDDPKALLRQCLGQMDEDTPFERNQPEQADREAF